MLDFLGVVKDRMMNEIPQLIKTVQRDRATCSCSKPKTQNCLIISKRVTYDWNKHALPHTLLLGLGEFPFSSLSCPS